MLPISLVGLLALVLVVVLPRLVTVLARRAAAQFRRPEERDHELGFPRGLQSRETAPSPQAPKAVSRAVRTVAPTRTEAPIAAAAAQPAAPVEAPPAAHTSSERIDRLPRLKRAVIWSEILKRPGPG